MWLVSFVSISSPVISPPFSSECFGFLRNAFSVQTIADIIRTCLGPKAMLKVSFSVLDDICEAKVVALVLMKPKIMKHKKVLQPGF